MSRIFIFLICSIGAAALTACTPPSASQRLMSQGAEDEPATVFSLFGGSESTLTDADIAALLAGRPEIPDRPRIAVLQVPGTTRARSYGIYGGLSEVELQMQTAYLDTLRATLLPTGVREVEVLPALLVPAQPTVPVLREVAVRLQADALLVFRVHGQIFENYRAFRSDEYKAYASCEAVLLDVRTGALPFTTVATRDVLTRKQEGDLNDADTRRRAEQTAVAQALGEMGRAVAAFLLNR